MKAENLKDLIEGKRQWTESLTAEEGAKGFKGWYSSKYLPHFDSPGVQQFITYTAKEANRILSRAGTFWGNDYFDRYIRDEDHYRRAVRYIENNPVKANLVQSAEEGPWSSARFRRGEDLRRDEGTNKAAE